jgi:type VI protein secretion system component Hcp
MRREHERARKDPERTDDERRPDASGPAADVLALQRTAGNHAVGALLARQPQPTAPPKKEEAPAAGHHVVFPGIGTIAIESVQMGGTMGRPNPPAGRREPAAPTFTEIHFTSRVGEHSTALFKASLDGKGADVEVFMPSGKTALVLKLSNALVSSYSTSGDRGEAFESWTLNFSAVEFVRQGEDEAK